MAGLYVHIPFCHSKCAYCDFYSMPVRNEENARRLCKAIVAEYDLRKSGMHFSTLYFGGGTPSILPISDLEGMSSAFFSSSQTSFVESTIEANPEDVSLDKAKAWRSLGYNRVSMGVQSLVDAELAFIGRHHSAQQAIDAFHTLREAGFDNISLDLIYGLPGQTLDTWLYSLKNLASLKPEHISAYTLSYEPRTRLTALLNAGKIQETPDETIFDMYEILISHLRENGYQHYEISNFALPGKHSRHNSSYWDKTPYLGLGPAAHSFDGDKRFYNPSNLNAYLQAIENGNIAAVLDEEDENNKFNDLLLTALRTIKGLPINSVQPQRLGQLLKDASPHLANGNLKLENGIIYIPEQRWLMSNCIISDLFQIE